MMFVYSAVLSMVILDCLGFILPYGVYLLARLRATCANLPMVNVGAVRRMFAQKVDSLVFPMSSGQIRSI